jgi:hypothetical protein
MADEVTDDGVREALLELANELERAAKTGIDRRQVGHPI